MVGTQTSQILHIIQVLYPHGVFTLQGFCGFPCLAIQQPILAILYLNLVLESSLISFGLSMTMCVCTVMQWLCFKLQSLILELNSILNQTVFLQLFNSNFTTFESIILFTIFSSSHVIGVKNKYEVMEARRAAAARAVHIAYCRIFYFPLITAVAMAELATNFTIKPVSSDQRYTYSRKRFASVPPRIFVFLKFDTRRQY